MQTAELEILNAEWSTLEEHLKRDALILISQELDLLETAKLVIADLKEQIERHIEDGLITKPTMPQIEVWRRQPNTPFRFVVAQPFVLIQLLSS